MRKLEKLARDEEEKLTIAEKALEDDALTFDMFLKENDRHGLIKLLAFVRVLLEPNFDRPFPKIISRGNSKGRENNAHQARPCCTYQATLLTKPNYSN